MQAIHRDPRLNAGVDIHWRQSWYKLSLHSHLRVLYLQSYNYFFSLKAAKWQQLTILDVDPVISQIRKLCLYHSPKLELTVYGFRSFFQTDKLQWQIRLNWRLPNSQIVAKRENVCGCAASSSIHPELGLRPDHSQNSSPACLSQSQQLTQPAGWLFDYKGMTFHRI